MFDYKKMLYFFVAIIAVLFITSLILTLFDDNIAQLIVPTKAKGIKTEWIGFWGNMFGSLIQGIVTAAGILVTLFIFKEDKKSIESKEKEQRDIEEKNIFIKEFGKNLSAYDMMISLVSHYDNLNDYYENESFTKLGLLTQEINEGEITARVSLMQREIIGYKRNREQGLFYYPEDTSYIDADGRIRRNMRHLQDLLLLKRKLQMEKYSDLTGIDLSEEVIWDKGRTFSAGGSITGVSSVSSNETVIRSNGEVE